MTTVDCHWERDDSDLQPPCSFGKQQLIELDFKSAFGDVEMVQVHAQNGLLSWLFARSTYAEHLLRLGLTQDNVYGCLANFMLQAAPRLQDKLPSNVMQTLQDNVVIGIQIRFVILTQCLYSEQGWL